MTNSKISSRFSEKGNEAMPGEEHRSLFTTQNPEHAEPEIIQSMTEETRPSGDTVTQLKEKQVASEKDYILKLETSQALCSAGYFVRINVALSEPPLSAKGAPKLTDITDVDVLAVAFAMDFHPDILCVSCKSGSSKGLSPIKETLMMAGVMQYLRAERGYAVFSDRKIDSHMYGLAQQLNIALFSLEEWRMWKNRQVGNRVSPAHFSSDVYVMLREMVSKRNDLEGLFGYTRGEYWYYRDFRNIQNLVGVARKYSKALSSTALGRYAFLDLLSLLALSVIQLCEYITFTGSSRLTETVPPYLFGGPSVYKSRKELLRRVEEMLRSRDVLDKDQQFPSLDPPYVNELAEVVTRFVQKPIDAVRVPHQINFVAGTAAAEAVGLTLNSIDSGESSTTQKFAFDLASLLIKTTGIDKAALKLL
jgi:hypothetical protein